MSDNELLLAISSMMDQKLGPIQKDISQIQDNMTDIKAQMMEMDVRVKRMEINLENEILPRLQNIESCYTSTYERYAKGVDQIENTMQDVALIKTVVTKHSEKLEKIS
ncbi:MAG: hypothetical protein HFG69_00175 [Hungatella sp.]|nr:hypothetical protein [Hungatella sp.]